MIKPVIYFANYSSIYQNRTTDCIKYDLLKDAKTFFENNSDASGYIIRQDVMGNTLDFETEGFIPCASERNKIQMILAN